MTDPVPASPPPLSAPLFDKQAFQRYRIPRVLGEAVSGVDDPPMVSAQNAHHMRADDYVIGLVHRGQPRAYPLWIVDNYHVVNDRVDGERIVVVSCERCQSGSAFLPDVPGDPEREPVFRSVGFLNATLILKDLRSASHWLHYEGLGLDRRAAGRRLPWLPTYHVEWADWRSWHPDTEVMVPPEDPTHPDARHGHGREEIFSRPGMDPAFLSTIVGDLDRTYPENEMVLAIDATDGWVAFPLREVQREGGTVPVTLDGREAVVLAGPGGDGFAMAAYVSSARGRSLSFHRDGDEFVDEPTGSRWTIEGTAIEGKLEGARLEPVPWWYVRWHAWVYWHRGTHLYRSVRERPLIGDEGTGSERLDRIAGAWSEAGRDVRIGEPLVSQRWPAQAVHSATVFVDGERVRLHEFATVSAARDLHAFDASWSGWPIGSRSHEGRTRRIGNVVLESDPEERYVDPANVVPLPDDQVAWGRAIEDRCLDELTVDGPAETAGPGFVDVIRSLRLSGYEVLDVGFLPRGQLRTGAENAVGLTIDAERFLLYRFRDEADADRYAAVESRAIGAGRYVLRSTPDTMYMHQPTEVLYVGDRAVRWSSLPDEPAFVRAFRSGAGADPDPGADEQPLVSRAVARAAGMKPEDERRDG